MDNKGFDNNLDAIAIFNTILGITNMEKNTASQEHSNILERKLDMVLGKLETLEGLILSRVVLSDILDENGVLKGLSQKGGISESERDVHDRI